MLHRLGSLVDTLLQWIPGFGNDASASPDHRSDAAADVERTLALVTAELPMLLALCDRELRYRFVNEPYAQRLGLQPKDLEGRRVPDVLGEEAYASLRQYIERALAGHVVEFEAEIPYEDLGRRLMSARYVPYGTENGRADGFVAVISDRTVQQRVETDRRKAEAELRESRDILEVVHRVGQIVAAGLDLDNVVQVVTDAATKLVRAQFGAFFYNRIDEQGEKYMLYTLSGVPRDAFAGFPMPRNTALFGATFHGEGVVRIADVTKDPRYGKNPPYHGKPPGHLPVTSYLAVPVVSRSGEVLGGLFFGHREVGVFTEYDERLVAGLAAQAAIGLDNARLYEADHRARAEAEAANRAKDEFLSVVSHELRTPLASMLGWVRVLRSGPSERTGRALDTLERNINVQRKLIEDLVDVSRMVTGRLSLDARPLNFAAVIRAAVDSMRVEAESKGVHLDVALDALPGPVAGDPERLEQIVLNLLSNAVKFTPEGGRVTVRLHAEDGAQASLVIEDTGKGMLPEFLPYVFERFRQADSVTGRETGGLGLGLAITRHLVELHGGTIRAESDGADRGARFTVLLPLASSLGSASPPSIA